MTNNLFPVEFNDQRILTTEQLAEVYGTEANNIKNNFNNHKEQFAEGKHYYLLKGEVLRQFKREVNDIDLVIAPNVNQLYLWTERGASRHCKILDTEKAWEQFDNLEDTYFRVKEQPKLCSRMDPLERKAKLDRSEAMRLNALSRLAKPLIEMYKEAEVPPAFKIRALENFYGTRTHYGRNCDRKEARHRIGLRDTSCTRCWRDHRRSGYPRDRKGQRPVRSQRPCQHDNRI